MSVSRTLIIRYRTRPEAAEENSRLVDAVFASLAEIKPVDFSYTAYRLADGVSFVHIARLDGTENPLATLHDVRGVPARPRATLRRAGGAEHSDGGRLLRAHPVTTRPTTNQLERTDMRA